MTGTDVLSLTIAGLAVVVAGWVVWSRLRRGRAMVLDDGPAAPSPPAVPPTAPTRDRTAPLPPPTIRSAGPTLGASAPTSRPSADPDGPAGAAGDLGGGDDAENERPRLARRGHREWPPRPPTLPQRPRTAAVSVLLIDRRDGTTNWRISSTTDSPLTVVDVFSFRHASTSGHRAWQHLLLEAPVELGPHGWVELPGPPSRGPYVVSVAWSTTIAGGGIHRERNMTTVEPTTG